MNRGYSADALAAIEFSKKLTESQKDILIDSHTDHNTHTSEYSLTQDDFVYSGENGKYENQRELGLREISVNGHGGREKGNGGNGYEGRENGRDVNGYHQNGYEGSGGDEYDVRKRKRDDITPRSNSSPVVFDYEADRKRKREEEEMWFRNVRRRVEEESDFVDHDHLETDRYNTSLYTLFNDLQALKSDLEIDFDSPELAVVGMQSDGKSTFIEGLLGFQFNIVDTNIGTRRPLIIQMINDNEYDEPNCKFRREIVTPGEDPFEDESVPVDYLGDEIRKRTDDLAGSDKNSVSSEPIILRVRYKYCSNLTIYDTPGFRLGGNDKLREDIERMVMDIIRPKHRIIVCLEQSTVEWTNSSSRPLVKRIDPDFSRTILVNTKFDNRVKELRDSESTDNYLEGEDIPSSVPMFFISLPVRRNLDPKRFKEDIKAVYLEDYRNLMNAKFNELKYLPRIGFLRLKKYLEQTMMRKYKQKLIPTLQKLEDLCRSTKSELNTVQQELENGDLELQKNKANSFVHSFNLLVRQLLEGSVVGDPDKYGLTLEDERINSGVEDWPYFFLDFSIENSDLKLYGGAQYERLLNEFEFVSHSIEFPDTSINEVASSIGTSKSHNVPSYEAAASDIVQNKAKKVLLPLVRIVLDRMTFIMQNLFDIIIAVLVNEDSQYSIIGRFPSFTEKLRCIFDGFVYNTRMECERKSLDDFLSFTAIMDWDLMSGISLSNNFSPNYDYLNPTPEATKKRVEDMMKIRHEVDGGARTRTVDMQSYDVVRMMAAKLFAGVRYFFTKYMRSKCNAFFLTPMFKGLGLELTESFRLMTDEDYAELFGRGLKQLAIRAEILEDQYSKAVQQRDHFKSVVKNFQRVQENS